METKAIVFGATGDLAKTKVLPAFSALGITPLLYGRKEINLERYIKGELNEITEKISDAGITHAYVSLPPAHYEMVLRQLAALPSVPRIALEKPFGTSYENAKSLVALIKELKLEKKMYLVDHYLAKPAILEMAELESDARKLKYDPYRMRAIWIDAFETHTVDNRGAFYDGVGTIRDFIQNHMLAMIGTIFMEKSDTDNASQCRTEALKKIVFMEGSLVLGQYDGYREVAGVSKDSRTETYTACTFQYANMLYINVRAGKALSKSEVKIHIDYSVGHTDCIDVQSTVNPYERILQDFLQNTSYLGLCVDEALICWDITEKILANKEFQKISFYPQGTDPDRFIW